MALPRKTAKRTASSPQRPTNQTGEDMDEEEEYTDNVGPQNDDEERDDDGTETSEDEVEPEVQEVPERIIGAPKDGRTYRTGEDVIFRGEKRGGLVISKEAIYRAAKAPGTDRWRFHLLLAKGSAVPIGKTKELEEGQFKTNETLIY